MKDAELQEKLHQYYSGDFHDVVYSGPGGLINKTFHSSIEKPWVPEKKFSNVLEVGVGGGEHLAFVNHQFDQYTMQDVFESEPARKAAQERSNRGEGNVDFVVGDAQTLEGIPNESVDRLVSMCLLHHLDDPLATLRRWREVVKPGGVISIYVPCDPGILWRIGRALTTFRVAQKKRGYSLEELRFLNACDHRNHFTSVHYMIEGAFAKDKVVTRRWPLPMLKSWNFNVFEAIQIEKR